MPHKSYKKRKHRKRRHRRTLKGGRFIGKGSYGCVFTPSFKCKPEDIYDPTKISKIMFVNDVVIKKTEAIENILKQYTHLNIFITNSNLCKFDPILQSSRDEDITEYNTNCLPEITRHTRDIYLLTQENGGDDLSLIYDEMKHKLTSPNYKSYLSYINKLIQSIFVLVLKHDSICNPYKIFNSHNIRGGGNTFGRLMKPDQMTKNVPYSPHYKDPDRVIPKQATPSRAEPALPAIPTQATPSRSEPALPAIPTQATPSRAEPALPAIPKAEFVITERPRVRSRFPQTFKFLFHGDIKPPNIVLNKDPRIFNSKFIDYDIITFTEFNNDTAQINFISFINDFKIVDSLTCEYLLYNFISYCQSIKFFEYAFYNSLFLVINDEIIMNLINENIKNINFERYEYFIEIEILEKIRYSFIQKFLHLKIFKDYIIKFINDYETSLKDLPSDNPHILLYNSFKLKLNAANNDNQTYKIYSEYYMQIIFNTTDPDFMDKKLRISHESLVAKFINSLFIPFIETHPTFTENNKIKQFILFQRLIKIIYSSEKIALLNILSQFVKLSVNAKLRDVHNDLTALRSDEDYILYQDILTDFDPLSDNTNPTSFLNTNY